MKVISHILKLDNYEYYIKHLEVLNILFFKGKNEMSKKEIEVLAAFMSQDNKLIEEDMFNGIVRKNVMKQLELKPGGLGNHLKSLTKKGYLEKNEITKRIKMKSFLFPESMMQGFRIKLVKNAVKE